MMKFQLFVSYLQIEEVISRAGWWYCLVVHVVYRYVKKHNRIRV